MRWLTLSAAVIVAAICQIAQAANTIDPNNVGATDVVDGSGSTLKKPSTGSVVRRSSHGRFYHQRRVAD